MKSTRLAIFDIDGTIFRSSLVIELTNALVAHGIFPPAARQEIEHDYTSWLNRRGTYESYIRQVVRVYRTYVVGQQELDIAAATDSVIREHKDKLYRFTRDLMRQLRAEGWFLLALSGSPALIVTKFAGAIGFADFRGNGYRTEGGIITATDDFASKKELLHQFLADNPRLSMEGSLVIGDTEGDIPILEEAGRAIAFNPNYTLAATQ